ncbi:MAG: hypothetical protein K2P39_15485 [Lachnospiraceae bacterium]|nr:hypothetical protein [Lachnospiraceae bacterium]
MKAVKDIARIHERELDIKYLNELYRFIRESGKYVFDDSENTIIRRMPGFAGWISSKIAE